MSLVEDRVVQQAGPGVEQRRPGDLESLAPADQTGSGAPAVDQPNLASALNGLASSSFDVAVNALRRGAQDIEVLSVRCDQLRSELSEAEDRHRQCLRSIREEVVRWQDIVDELVEHYQLKDQQLKDAVLERILSDERAVGEFRRAKAAEQRLANFERLMLGIHDQILSAIVKDRCDYPTNPSA